MSNWTANDAVRLRTFLHQTPAFIERLTSVLTESKGETLEARAISGAERAGGERLIKEIGKMKVNAIKGDTSPSIADESEPTS